MQINLKPLDERKISASDVIRRLQPNIEKVSGITLYMQPVQDLTLTIVSAGRNSNTRWKIPTRTN